MEPGSAAGREQVVHGVVRQTLVHFDRNGFAYVIERATGKVLRADKFAEVNWAKSVDLATGLPVEDPTKRTKQGANTEGICPGAMGANR